MVSWLKVRVLHTLCVLGIDRRIRSGKKAKGKARRWLSWSESPIKICLFTYFDCLPEYSSSCVYFYPSYKTSPHLCYWFLHSLHYRAPSPGLPSLRNFKQQSCRDEDEQLPRTSSICTPGQLKRQITLQGFMVFFLLKNTVDKKTKQKNAHCLNLHQIFVPCVCTNKNACLFLH